MIKFSWKKLNDKFSWNIHDVLQFLYIKQDIKLPSFIDKKVPIVIKRAAKQPYPTGECFLVNLNDALINASSPQDLYVYLELASKRNVFDYLVRKVSYLPDYLVPEYLIEWVNNNPMLEVKNGNIYFKYEQR